MGDCQSPILKISSLRYAYPGFQNGEGSVLKGIDVEIASGERVGLIGPNGAGKTTLFTIICGALKASGGEILFQNEPITPGKFNKGIGLIFQNTDDQLFCPTVADDVAFAPQNLGLSPSEVEQQVSNTLATMGISNLANRHIHCLSEGEKRLVAIAGILAMKPQLILYDEPSANLDIRFRRRLISFLKNSPETIVIASHDLEMILETCQRVILMDKGCIVADGPSREIMANEALMEAHGQEKPHSLLPHIIEHRHARTS